MSITCYENIGYCCGLSKPCIWRDSCRQVLGIDDETYVQVKKEDEIWLIEAEKKLNYEALGQVLTYKGLYQAHFSPSKTIKLGIVCEAGDEDIEKAYKKEGVAVFIAGKRAEEIKEAPICGICGSKMILEGYECKTCEYYFGMSSMVKRCLTCGAKFGSYEEIEKRILEAIFVTPSNIRTYGRGRLYCLKCREKVPEGANWRTIADLIKENNPISTSNDGKFAT